MKRLNAATIIREFFKQDDGDDYSSSFIPKADNQLIKMQTWDNSWKEVEKAERFADGNVNFFTDDLEDTIESNIHEVLPLRVFNEV